MESQSSLISILLGCLFLCAVAEPEIKDSYQCKAWIRMTIVRYKPRLNKYKPTEYGQARGGCGNERVLHPKLVATP